MLKSGTKKRFFDGALSPSTTNTRVIAHPDNCLAWKVGIKWVTQISKAKKKSNIQSIRHGRTFSFGICWPTNQHFTLCGKALTYSKLVHAILRSAAQSRAGAGPQGDLVLGGGQLILRLPQAALKGCNAALQSRTRVAST